MGLFRNVAHEDPASDWRTFDLDRDTSLIHKKAGFIDAVNAHLSAFRARRGKLLIYHGWNDGGSVGRSRRRTASTITRACWPGWAEARGLAATLHGARYGTLPGWPGPNHVNWMAAMERWRESGIAPDRLIASRVSDNRVNITRPVCPYPQVAQHTGVAARTTRQTSFAKCGELLPMRATPASTTRSSTWTRR